MERDGFEYGLGFGSQVLRLLAALARIIFWKCQTYLLVAFDACCVHAVHNISDALLKATSASFVSAWPAKSALYALSKLMCMFDFTTEFQIAVDEHKDSSIRASFDPVGWLFSQSRCFLKYSNPVASIWLNDNRFVYFVGQCCASSELCVLPRFCQRFCLATVCDSRQSHCEI